ncbi:hybrid sensor histidine kinase/response regulator [Desertibaculum subflavum]|uniref:hybrid sensor histidine kinase/response regulator n=1 Tax=Desertibaculum subflavum TaxID=2268458 RepID=UPI0013C4E34E
MDRSAAPGDAALAVQVGDILDRISDGFVAFDNDWRFVHINAAAQRMAERPAQDFIGRTAFDALNIDPRNPFHLAYTASKASGEPVAFTAYSEIFSAWLEVRGFPNMDGYTILFRDVTGARRAHRTTLEGRHNLEVARAISQRIVETSQDLILVTDRQGNLVQVSPSSAAILGFRRDEMEGRSAIDFIHPDDLESTRNEMRESRRGGHTRSFDCRYLHRDGRAVALAWTGTWSPPEQQHFFIGRDMTERLAAEERQRRSQRLEAVGQLTGGIAHDFNNLLTVVIGNLDLLEFRLRADPAAAELAASALKASLRGAELTRQLLAFARRQALDARVFDVNERVVGTMDLLRRTLGEAIEISTRLDPDLWSAFADPAQLESALVNLAINARDAMPGGGRLIIETANRELDADYARINIDAVPGAYVMLSVSDTGIGMPPEVLARVFEPFFTTKPVGQGTGLGLSMVYGFARQSHGHVKIYSEAGHGTTARLYLPRSKDAAIADRLVPAGLPVARPGERVLVVEDNDAVRAMVLQQMRDLGYDVVEAGDGPAALAVVDGGQRFDLLFTDIVMPGGMSGSDLARAVRSRDPSVKVLLTSGFAGGAMPSGVHGDEFRDLLSKPYRQSDLAAKLRQVLDEPA